LDIESLKEAIGDEKFAALKAHVDGLEGKLSTVRKKADSETANAAKLRDAQEKLMEKLGVASLDEIDALPDAKGQAEAVKQFEVKLKKMERDMAAAVAERDEASSKYKTSLQRAAIADALAGHEFVARDLMEGYIANRLAWEGDDLMFKADDGKVISLKDGVAGLAKSRPELLKPTGTGGAGMRSTNAGSNGQPKTMSNAEFEGLRPAERAKVMADGITLTD
jgi:hypothetical protein